MMNTLNDKSNIIPPGKKKRKGRAFPKGRHLSVVAQQDISELLANKPRRRDLLIEYLHLIQDKWNAISEQHLHALANEMQLSQAEVYEVATFYHHFDVIKADQQAAEITVRVCNSLSCCQAGAENILKELQENHPANSKVVAAPCMGLCDQAPAASIGKNYVGHITTDSVRELINQNKTKPSIPSYQSLDEYLKKGGYSHLKALKNGDLSADSVVQAIKDSGLKGLGGAGFPTATKLDIVRSQPAPKFVCMNADEGEPGTFKDRLYLSSKPHQILEGLLIAAHVIGASQAYIYLRDEYSAIHSILTKEITELSKQGLIEEGAIDLRRGAGAYICGEESAMVESIEGKRGIPRQRPPYVAHQGLFQRPTLIQNVETLYWLPEIVKQGGKWFAEQGKNGAKGPRSYSVSGRVKNPAVITTAAGSTVEELIALCGGMLEGHTFRAYLPGGASGGILPAKLGNVPLDFSTLDQYGCFVGSHAVVILSDQDELADVAVNLMDFFKHESCGQCTPCRVGCEKTYELLKQPVWDKPLLRELSSTMTSASICGLGQAAPNPVLSILNHFNEANDDS